MHAETADPNHTPDNAPVLGPDSADRPIITHGPHGVRVELAGPLLSDAQVRLVGEALASWTGPQPGTPVVLDFSRVRYLSTPAAGALLTLDRRLRDRGGRLCVAGLHEHLRGVFAITHLDQVLAVFPTPEEALRPWGDQ